MHRDILKIDNWYQVRVDTGHYRFEHYLIVIACNWPIVNTMPSTAQYECTILGVYVLQTIIVPLH